MTEPVRLDAPTYKPGRRSVSQHNQYVRCPLSYKLSRIDKVWRRPASWLSQGLAVHAAMEHWEKSDRTATLEELEAIYEDEFWASIGDQQTTTPDLEMWFGSGPYDPVADVERRRRVGWKQIQDLIAYTNDKGDPVWTTPDGKKAIELKFEVELGGVPVIGFIDKIVETNKGLTVRDIKTGAKPGDKFQLATYAEAIRLMYGVTIERGDYHMGKTGRPGRVQRITAADRQEVHEHFAWLEEQLKAGLFPPTEDESKCKMCDVAASCPFAR